MALAFFCSYFDKDIQGLIFGRFDTFIVKLEQGGGHLDPDSFKSHCDTLLPRFSRILNLCVKLCLDKNEAV